MPLIVRWEEESERSVLTYLLLLADYLGLEIGIETTGEGRGKKREVKAEITASYSPSSQNPNEEEISQGEKGEEKKKKRKLTHFLLFLRQRRRAEDLQRKKGEGEKKKEKKADPAFISLLPIFKHSYLTLEGKVERKKRRRQCIINGSRHIFHPSPPLSSHQFRSNTTT